MTIDEVIGAYLKLRAAKEEITKRHKEELAPINERMEKCKLWVQQQLQAQGLQNMKAASGTAFLQTDTTVSSADWDATLAWIQANNAWAFLEKRVSKSVVQDYIESTGQVPPGLKVTTSIEAHIRKS